MDEAVRRKADQRAAIAALDSSPVELYREFSENPVGKHSPNLQLVLLYMRGAPVKGKYVLLAEETHKSWVLAELTGVRGDPVIVYEKVRYTDLAVAERDIYRRRWRALMGEEVP